MYYDKDTRVMVNQSVNEFYTRLLFKIDALQQDIAFPLNIAANFFNNLIPKVREFLISERVQVPPRPPAEKITRETRGYFWSEMQQCNKKIR